MDQTGSEHLTRLNGPFFGNGLDRVQLDLYLASRWPERQLEVEPERLNGAWFDYRFAHPALRLLYFCHVYVLEWRWAFRRFYDHEAKVDHVVPFPGSSRNIYRQSESFIRNAILAMQFADEVRVPYEVFFRAGFFAIMQHDFNGLKRRRKDLRGVRLPPLRVFKRADVAQAAQTRLDKLSLKAPVHAIHSAYRTAAWRETSFQVEHREFLLHEASRLGAGRMRRLRQYVDADLLPESVLSGDWRA